MSILCVSLPWHIQLQPQLLQMLSMAISISSLPYVPWFNKHKDRSVSSAILNQRNYNRSLSSLGNCKSNPNRYSLQLIRYWHVDEMNLSSRDLSIVVQRRSATSSPQESSRFTPDSRIVTCVLDLSDSRPIRQAIGPADFRGEKGLYSAALRCTHTGGRTWEGPPAGHDLATPQQPPHGTADNDAVGLWSTQTDQAPDPDPDQDPQLLRIPTLSLPLLPSPAATHSAFLFSFVPGRQPSAPAPTPAPTHPHTPHPQSAKTAANNLLVIISFPELSGPLPCARHAAMPSLPPVPRVLPHPPSPA